MKKIVFALITLFPALALANPGPYVQAQAGLNTVSTDSSTSNGIAGGVGMGYLWSDSDMGVDGGLEIDGVSYPSSSANNYTYNGYNISLLGVLKFTPYFPGFVGFVKGGAAYVNQKFSFKNSSGSNTQSSIEPEAVVGVGYQFNQNLELDLSADFIGIWNNKGTPNLSNNDTSPNNNYLLGLTYHFA